MSEPYGVSITIGGNLPATLLPAFKDALLKDLDCLVGPEDFDPGTTVSCNYWEGLANYGNVNTIKTFCMNHNLSYKYTCEPGNESDGEVSFWTPGMKNEEFQIAGQSGEPMVKVEKIRPYLNMLTNMVEDGRPSLEFLPLLINDEELGPLTTEMMKSKTPYKVLAEKLAQILPSEIPDIPDLFIEAS